MMCKKLLLIILMLCLASNAWAQMPVSRDVGGPDIAGSVAYSPGTGFAGSDEWTIQGSGGDIWGTWDQFQFVFRPLVGDGEASVRVASMTSVHDWAKVGVMIRETLDGDSKYVAMLLTGSNGVGSHWREETGGGSSNAMIPNYVAPHWVKIVRTGDTISTWHSFAGDQFFLPAQTLTVPMNETVYIGMCVTSHDNGQLETVVFDAVDLQAPPALNAWNLSPANGALIQEMTATLSWEAGDTAASHNVYFGTSSPPDLVVNQAETSYTSALEGGTTYYWQIGEVEADGVTEHLGEERSFSTYREGTGSILREVWEGIGGVAVADLTSNPAYPDNVTWSDELTSINVTDFADNFGSRIHGYLCPETSGDYTFWIASDDASQLWLSTSESPADAEMLCEEPGCCHDYDGIPEQKSDPVYLEGGQKYYISAMYKEGGGGDWCKVAWEGPDAPSRTEIDGYYLMPYVNLNASAPSPLNGAILPPDPTTLSWSAGPSASSYDVYFGTSSPPEFIGNQAETSYDPGTLEYGTTYYWHIDAVEADGTTKYVGNEWSFSTLMRGPGQMKHEIWWGIGGGAVGDLTGNDRYPDSPDIVDFINIFETPTDMADNYGARVSGWLHVPSTGDYTFWIATDDGSNLNLSTDEDPANVVLIAQESGWSTSREWKTGEQMSDPIALTSGEIYYIEALHKEGGGGDNLAVAWEGPGVPFGVISGDFVGATQTRPLAAYAMAPSDGATGLGLTPTLKWLPGDAAASYDVYLDGALLGNTTDTSMAVGPLVLGETYHPSTYTWQVDTIEADGTKHTGAVLSFSVANNVLVEDFDAYDDLAVPVAPDDAGLLVDLRAEDLPDGEVTTWANRGSLGDFTANGAPIVEDVDGVKAATFDGSSWFDGPTSTESIEGGSDRSITVLAYNPEIAEEETTVSWSHRGGPDGTNIAFNYGNHGTWGAAGHWGAADVGWWGQNSPAPAAGTWWHLTYTYDGTAVRVYVNGIEESYNAVPLNTHAGNIIRVGAQADGTGEGVEAGLNYTGSIAEVRIYDSALSAGEVMYLAGARAPVAENPLANTWSESGFVNASGGDGTMEVETFALPGMPYYLGEVSRTLPIDLTEGGAKALSVWFRGDEGNNAEFMYAALSSGNQSAMVLYDGDADDLANPDWQEWNIDMRDFGGVEDVATEISIGIAGLDGSSAGDVMNFDDIRVYTGRCMPDRRKPEADINNDCVVNMDDAEEIMDAWGFVAEGWQIEWISDESPEGSASYDAGTDTWTVTGHGHDIWDNADDFEYVYQMVSGDCEISARVVEMPGPSVHDWSKAGVMIRETNAEGSKMTIEAMTGGEGGGAGMQWRDNTNGGCGWSEITEPVVAPPYYVRLVRTGNLFEAFQSADGVTWDKETEHTVDMAEDVLIGLAVTSHESGVMRSGVFDNVNIIGDIVPMPAPAADINDDDAVDWGDLIVLLNGWLDEQLWPY